MERIENRIFDEFRLGDTVTVTGRIIEKIAATHRVVLDCRAINQNGDEIIAGTAEVIAPTEKTPSDIEVRRKGRRYEHLIEMTRGLQPIRTAVVHPVEIGRAHV